MTRIERKRYQLFLRIRDFGIAHQKEFPATSVAGKAFAAVTEAAAVIERETTQREVAADDGRKARAEARADLWDRLTDIVRTAQAAGRTELVPVALFKRPDRRGDMALIEAARGFIGKGGRAASQWVLLGLPATTIADLQKALTRLEQAVTVRKEARDTSRAAGVRIRNAFEQGFDAVHQLDAIVANTFKHDEPRLAVWAGDRRFMPKPRGKHAIVPPAPEPEPVPAPTPAPTPEPVPVVPPAPPADGPTPIADSTTSGATPDDGLRKAS